MTSTGAPALAPYQETTMMTYAETLRSECSPHQIRTMVETAQDTILLLWGAGGAARVIELSGEFLEAHRAGQVDYARVVCRFCGVIAPAHHLGAVCADDDCDGSWDCGALIPEWEAV
jgi:hypothetical protein